MKCPDCKGIGTDWWVEGNPKSTTKCPTCKGKDTIVKCPECGEPLGYDPLIGYYCDKDCKFDGNLGGWKKGTGEVPDPKGREDDLHDRHEGKNCNIVWLLRRSGADEKIIDKVIKELEWDYVPRSSLKLDGKVCKCGREMEVQWVCETCGNREG